MKIDPYKHKETYLNWKNEIRDGIPDLSKKNSDLLLKYLEDTECGLNVSVRNRKGSRGFPRLNTLRQRLKFMFKEFEERDDLKLTLKLLIKQYKKTLKEVSTKKKKS